MITSPPGPPPHRLSGSVQDIAMGDALPVEEASASSGQLPFFTIAIGASAGGVEALMRLFALMPLDTGCAFVVALHLPPDRESMLVPLLARATKLPVAVATQDAPLEPDHVYVAP